MHFRIIAFISAVLLLFACNSQSSTLRDSSTSLQQETYIENKGSDTIVNLALAWAETYQSQHPNISISVTGGGSGTGIAATHLETEAGNRYRLAR